MNIQPVLLLLGSLAAFVLGIAVAVCSRRPIIQRFEGQCRALQAQVDNHAHALSLAENEKQVLERELVELRDELAAGTTRNEQLRDIVKMHVARRIEFDEWAGPIKASLGETVGQTVRTLKTQLARQDRVLQRQEQLVAGSHAWDRSQRGEIEHMRRELSMKNYHIAALNERFIRIEERIRDLCMQVAELPTQGGGSAQALADADTGPQPTDRHTRVGPQAKPPEDWTQLLNEWHQRLDRRFGELDAIQAELRSSGDTEAAGAARFAVARAGNADATLQ